MIEDNDELIVLRKPLRFNIGYADTIGKRKNMEDKMFVLGQVKMNINIDAFGIFDGHGGAKISRYANKAFPILLESRLKSSKPKPKSTLMDVFQLDFFNDRYFRMFKKGLWKIL